MINQRSFYLTTIPGLEPVSHLELCDKWLQAADFFDLLDFPQVEFFKGGLEFSAPLLLGLELHPYLRIPNRILLREKSFLTLDEAEFLKGLKQISWNNYFDKGDHFDFQFSSRSSRISMKSQVKKCLQQVLKSCGVSYRKGGTTIYVRIFRDKCNISFDCSGDLSFKRGQDKKVSIASLRESTASGLLRVLFQGIDEPFQLIDPMCGSGTFLSEALQINQKIKRSFQFEKFPIYKQKKKESLHFPPSHYSSPKKVFGFDVHEKATRLAQKNGQSFKKGRYQVEMADLFSIDQGLSIDSHLKKVVIVNPPWGKRLTASSKDLLKAIEQKYRPQRMGLLMPAHWKVSLSSMEKVRDIPIVNSGVENRFLVFSRP